MRKGRSVAETALIVATFPLYPEFANYPSEVVTDIFQRRPNGALLSSIVGRETSIPIGQHIRQLARMATLQSASNYRVIPPLTTASEGEQLMMNYLQRVS